MNFSRDSTGWHVIIFETCVQRIGGVLGVENSVFIFLLYLQNCQFVFHKTVISIYYRYTGQPTYFTYSALNCKIFFSLKTKKKTNNVNYIQLYISMIISPYWLRVYKDLKSNKHNIIPYILCVWKYINTRIFFGFYKNRYLYDMCTTSRSVYFSFHTVVCLSRRFCGYDKLNDILKSLYVMIYTSLYVCIISEIFEFYITPVYQRRRYLVLFSCSDYRR